MTINKQQFSEFLLELAQLENGYQTVIFNNSKYSMIISRPVPDKIFKLFAKDLSGTDIISFNLFLLQDKQAKLCPCEMSSQKVIEFVLKMERFHQR